MVHENGEVCRCGKRGCLETVSSATALIRQARELIKRYPDCKLARDPRGVNLDTIEEAFQAEDPLTCDLAGAANFRIAISNGWNPKYS
jgi:predicted NBD/HSP70 family sugar kinase